MEQANYSLVIRNAHAQHGLLRSSDVQTLRDYGSKIARNPAHSGDLMVLGPYGHAVEKFDIWTNAWRGDC